jgi:hypothetical protein
MFGYIEYGNISNVNGAPRANCVSSHMYFSNKPSYLHHIFKTTLLSPSEYFQKDSHIIECVCFTLFFSNNIRSVCNDRIANVLRAMFKTRIPRTCLETDPSLQTLYWNSPLLVLWTTRKEEKSGLAAGAAAGCAPHGGAAKGLVDAVQARPPRRRLLLPRSPLAAVVVLREERLDGARRAPLARERGEAVHETGEVDGGGLVLEHRVREEEVDGARLQRVAGAERPSPGLQQVRGRAEHVGVLLLAGDVRDGDGTSRVRREVLDVAVGVDDAHAGERGQRAGTRRGGEGATHR